MLKSQRNELWALLPQPLREELHALYMEMNANPRAGSEWYRSRILLMDEIFGFTNLRFGGDGCGEWRQDKTRKKIPAEQEKWLRENFPTLTSETCSVYLGWTKARVDYTARKLGIKKDPEAVRAHRSGWRKLRKNKESN